jgi:hypothetical protein
MGRRKNFYAVSKRPPGLLSVQVHRTEMGTLFTVQQVPRIIPVFDATQE